MKKIELNLGWEKRAAPIIKKPALKDFMNRQIAVQPSAKPTNKK